MTDGYSFENHLVSQDVLSELLKNELHCHAMPMCRAKVMGIFPAQYDAFLEATKGINFRIFVARRCSIEQLEPLPTRINQLANVALTSLTPTDPDPSTRVILEREPSNEEEQALLPIFEALESKMRYRGKFALLFFRKWLDLLIADRNSPNSELFPGIDREGLIARGPISLDSLAAKSQLPLGLRDFILKIASPAPKSVVATC